MSDSFTIYIAASYKHLHAVRLLHEALRAAVPGIRILDWTDKASPPPSMTPAQRREWFDTDHGGEVFSFCRDACQNADLVIYLGASGQDAGVEIGMASAAGVPVLGLRGPLEAPGLMLHGAVDCWVMDAEYAVRVSLMWRLAAMMTRKSVMTRCAAISACARAGALWRRRWGHERCHALSRCGRPHPGPAHGQGKCVVTDHTHRAHQESHGHLAGTACLASGSQDRAFTGAYRDWHEAWDGNVSVSYSGGKDSGVLLWLVRQLYPDVPAVFCHTGLEYPEVVSLVLDTPNHVMLRPRLPFGEVITRHGWPIASKKIARGIEILRNPTDRNQNIYRLYDEGINRFGQPVNGRRVSQCWRFLVDAPFKVSDKCCEVMKKEPMRRHRRATGQTPFVGLLASDSKEREISYLKSGCNAYDSKEPKSTPLAFWTEQDVLECVLRYRIPLAEVYGSIVEDSAGRLRTTGLRRTGCVFCAFGIHMDLHDGPETRFEQLKRTHPRLWIYVIHRLGLGTVLRYCRDNTPMPSLAKRLRWGEEVRA